MKASVAGFEFLERNITSCEVLVSLSPDLRDACMGQIRVCALRFPRAEGSFPRVWFDVLCN